MPSAARVAMPLLAAFLALLILGAPAVAAPKRIAGKLSKPGYTVIALAANGEAKAVRATPKFKLRPPDRRVSLQLRGRNGVYAGPIVVGTSENGRSAVVGVIFWRPQREAIGNEQGQWTEIGGLLYAPGMSKDYRPPLANCPQGAIFTNDPPLTVARSSAQYGNGYGVLDTAEDRQADPGHTFSLSVNLTQCLGGFEQGEDARMWFVASLVGNTTAGYSATQYLLFARQ